MASFNRVILMGNVVADPEVRYTSGGTAVTDLRMAVNRYWFDKTANERKEETTFLDVTLWGRTAEIAGEYLGKGRPVLVEGRLQMDQWEDRESGQKRSKLKVIGESMQLLGGRDGGGGAPRSGSGESGFDRPAAPDQSAADPAASFYDSPPSDPPSDEVPF